MKIINSKVLSVKHLSGENFQLEILASGIAEKAAPGQFIEISTHSATLLNKPISIANVDCNQQKMSFVIKKIGKGTKAISELAPGDTVKVIGPCGNAFPKPGKEAVLVGGGIGIPPLFFFAKFYPKTTFKVILGAKSKDDIVLEQKFNSLENTDVIVTTDDGSKGSKGTVIPPLEKILNEKAITVYSCGPKQMLEAVAKSGAEANADVFVSLEAYMACGIGVCMGCVVKTVRGLERVCKEGPVFLAKDILW